MGKQAVSAQSPGTVAQLPHTPAVKQRASPATPSNCLPVSAPTRDCNGGGKQNEAYDDCTVVGRASIAKLNISHQKLNHTTRKTGSKCFTRT